MAPVSGIDTRSLVDIAPGEAMENAPSSGAYLDADAKAAIAAYAALLELKGYPNREKLRWVFEHWMVNFLVGSWNLPGAKAEKCLNPLIHFSSRDSISFTKHSVREKTSLAGFAKRNVWGILARFPIRTAVFPGGNKGHSSRFWETVSYTKLRRIAFTVDAEFRSDFLAILKQKTSALFFGRVAGFLPDEFFFRPSAPRGYPRTVEGSFACMFTLDYIKILFLNQPIHFTSIQHGGCYGEYRWNWYEAIETRFADRFCHWGLGKYNRIQNRFPIHASSKTPVRDLVLVGTVKPNAFMELYFGGIGKIYGECGEMRRRILPVLSAITPIRNLVHPKYKEDLGGLVQAEVSLSKLTRNELERSLFLLDQPGHTFLYKALYEGLPFILFYRREWRALLTDPFNALLDELENEGLLFYWDRQDAFVERIREIFRSNRFPDRAHAKLRRFLEANIPIRKV